MQTNNPDSLHRGLARQRRWTTDWRQRLIGGIPVEDIEQQNADNIKTVEHPDLAHIFSRLPR